MAPEGRAARTMAALVLTATAALWMAGPAAADTAQARATAVRISLLGGPVFDSGQAVAVDDGATGGTEAGPTYPPVPPGQTLVTGGFLAQDVVAGGNGTSAACAGAFGQAGSMQVDPAGACVVGGGTPEQFVAIDLNQRARFTAAAVYAECTATSGGGPATGRATVTDGVLSFFSPSYIPVVPDPDPPPNFRFDYFEASRFGFITLNEQIPIPGGGLTVNAMHLTVPPNPATGAPQADIVLGSVTCGPNVDTEAVPIFSGPALPAAAAAAAAVGFAHVRCRRVQATRGRPGRGRPSSAPG